MSGADPEGAPRKGRARLLERATVALAALASMLVGIGCSPESRTRPRVRQVIIREMRYEPVELTVAVGDTVEWVNRDLVPHTATAQSREWDPGAARRRLIQTAVYPPSTR